MRKFKNYSLNDKIFYIIITAILTFFFIAVLYPCIFVLSASFSSGVAVQSGKVILFPVDLSIEGYRLCLIPARSGQVLSIPFSTPWWERRSIW